MKTLGTEWMPILFMNKQLTGHSRLVSAKILLPQYLKRSLCNSKYYRKHPYKFDMEQIKLIAAEILSKIG
jgi:hypothetical protein